MPKHYVFDRNSFSFKRTGRSFLNVLFAVLKFLIVTAIITLIYYAVFAIFFSTDSERRLQRENRLYEKLYPQMKERSELVGDVITGIQAKDAKIYYDIFHAQSPGLEPLDMTEMFAESDSVPDKKIVRYTAHKADVLLEASAKVETMLSSACRLATESRDSLPPLSLPLRASSAQIGASIGEKVNPFYKVPVMHDGLDIIASQGDDVLCAADGVVTKVTMSRKGLGNVVEITHPGGYVTRYCHLSDIEVRAGRRVRRGQKIASVGISGNSFAPHLHFEVLKDGEPRNPVHFFFASVTPEEYANMLFMSVNTGQSMD